MRIESVELVALPNAPTWRYTPGARVAEQPTRKAVGACAMAWLPPRALRRCVAMAVRNQSSSPPVTISGQSQNWLRRPVSTPLPTC